MDQENRRLTPLRELYERNPAPMEFYVEELQNSFDLWKVGKAEGISTGIKTFDPYWRLIESELSILAARPGMGKTAMALQIADEIAGPESIPAIFSAEMSGKMLAARMAAAKAGVPLHKIMQGLGETSELERFQAAMDALRNSHIWIDDSSSPSTSSMLQKLDAMREAKIPITLMIFDFMGLAGDPSKASENQRVSEIVTNLKAIAKALRIPVIALSQLSRKVEDTASKQPSLSHLRDSGQIEQVADNVVFIVRTGYYRERGETVNYPGDDPLRNDLVFSTIAKNRNGPTGIVKLDWDAKTMLFRKHLKLNLKGGSVK